MSYDKSVAAKVLARAKDAGRESLTAPEAKELCEAYGIAVPREALAKSAAEAATAAGKVGFPVVMKIVSPQILHKTEAGGVLVGVKSADQVAQGFSMRVHSHLLPGASSRQPLQLQCCA